MMVHNGLEIEYGDIAHNAKENFLPDASEQFEYSNIKQLQEYNLNVLNYVNPCEKYSVPLNGETMPLPGELSDLEKVGYISNSLSDEEYTEGKGFEFTSPIIITLTAEGEKYTSKGITLWFDSDNDIYPTELKIEFYQDDTLLNSTVDYPESPAFTYEKNIEEYNKIVLTFYALNLPRNRLKIRSIDYGYGTKFSGKDAVDAKVYQKINPTMAEFIANSATGYIRQSAFSYYDFLKNNLLKIYFNNELKQVVIITEIKTMNEGTYQIKGEDVVVLLDSYLAESNLLDVGNFAIEYIEEMLSSQGIQIEIDEDVTTYPTRTGETVNTHTFRNIMNELGFASLKKTTIIDTSESEHLRIRSLNDDIAQKIPLSRQASMPEIKQDEIVETITLRYLKKSIVDGGGDAEQVYYDSRSYFENLISPQEAIRVKGNLPVYKWTAYGEQSVSGEVIELTNFEIVDEYTAILYPSNPNNSYLRSIWVWATYFAFNYTETSEKVYNRNLELRNSSKTELEIKSNILFEDSVPDIVQKCRDWYFKNGEMKAKIVEGKHSVGGETIKWGAKKWGSFKYGAKTEKTYIFDKPVKIGDVLEIERRDAENYVGRVFAQEYTCKGGILVKDVWLK